MAKTRVDFSCDCFARRFQLVGLFYAYKSVKQCDLRVYCYAELNTNLTKK